MEHWIEALSYVDDFNVARWIETWELVVDDVQFKCLKCNAVFTSNAAYKFHYTSSHTPTGRDFLVLVEDYFSLQKQQ